MGSMSFFLPVDLRDDRWGGDGDDEDGDVVTESNSGSELLGSDEGGGFDFFISFGLITPIFTFLFAVADAEALPFAAFVFAVLVFAAFVAIFFLRAAFFSFTCSSSATACHA